MATKEKKEAAPKDPKASKASLEEINAKLDSLTSSQRSEAVWHWIKRAIWLVAIAAAVYYGYTYYQEFRTSLNINSIDDLVNYIKGFLGTVAPGVVPPSPPTP